MSAVLLLDAGGTISARPAANGALAGGERLELAGEVGEVETRQVYRGLSEEMSLSDACAVVAAAQAAADEPGVTGLVVTHGTDAMEETAFLAQLAWRSAAPLVFTGAQRAPGAADFDGASNLALALRAAADPALKGAGVLIAFGGRLLAAHGAFKAHTQELAGFDRRFDQDMGATERRPPPLPRLTPDETVEIIPAGLGVGGRMVRAAANSGARGLVLQAMGRGNASPDMVQAIGEAIAGGCVVMVASRCPYGAAGADYAAGRALADAGAIFVGDLGPAQARLLLAAMLGLHERPLEAREALTAWLAS